MLVLSRKLEEKVMIGNDITVTVVALHSNCVKLGVDAPESMVVLREELLEREDEVVRVSEGDGTTGRVGNGLGVGER